jgi:hypothetical protein
MNKHFTLAAMFFITAALMTSGCDDDVDDRLVQQAERHEQRQATQNQRAHELQREVAAGARQLVEADAKTRAELAALQTAIQSERNEIGRQRDQLEEDRLANATNRQFDSLLAAAVNNVGLLLACLLPLGLAWLLLRKADEPVSDHVVVETLLADLASTEPHLLVHGPSGNPTKSPRLGDQQTHHNSKPTNEEDF